MPSCMCPGSDEPRVQQGNCSEPRSPSIFPNLRLGSRTTFVPIRPKTEAPRRAAELSQLSASAWLRAADRALRDEKKCFPLKDELLALGWASSRGRPQSGRGAEEHRLFSSSSTTHARLCALQRPTLAAHGVGHGTGASQAQATRHRHQQRHRHRVALRSTARTRTDDPPTKASLSPRIAGNSELRGLQSP